MNDRDKWNRIYGSCDHENDNACDVLMENRHLLPASGSALDIACGHGANALLLACHGLATHAWDISDAAIERLQQRIHETGLNLFPQQRDVLEDPPPPDTYDVIVVSRFLDRGLILPLIRSLRPKGLIFYQTFTRNKLEEIGPVNRDYLLESNELLVLFDGLTVIFYRENDRSGDLTRGNRNEAMLVARRDS